MTPDEAKIAFREFERTVGPEAWISVSLTHDVSYADGSLSCSVYPTGVTHRMAFQVFADDFPSLLDKAQEKWREHGVEFRRQSVRKMALAIIRITADVGHCTDAALRTEFTAAEVAAFSADAVKDANVIADKGPFEIVMLGGANGAPSEIGETAGRA